MNESINEPVWYRQFWPWFLIVLPGSVVIASFVTLYIAIVNSHSMVKDDYYKDGLAINQYLHEDKLAQQMNLTAALSFDVDNNEINLLLNGQTTQANQLLILSFIDPVNASADFDLPLQASADNSYRQSVLNLDMKRWYLQLAPADATADQRWRIRGEIDLTKTLHTTLASTPFE